MPSQISKIIKSAKTRILDAYYIEPKKYEKKGAFLTDI